MQLKFLGTGGAFDPNYGNSSVLITLNNENILLDCGHTVFPVLFKLGLINKIDALILTHLHDDHCGSLGTLAFYFNKISPKRKLKIYYPTDKFKKEIEGFLRGIHCDPATHIEFVALSEIPGIDFIDTFGKHVENVQTHAYSFRENDEHFIYSGDLGDCDFLFSEIDKRNWNNATIFHEVIFYPGIKSHSYYKSLEPYLKNHKIFGYHCDPALAPENNKIPLVANYREWLY